HSAGAAGVVGKQTFDQPGAAITNLTYATGSIFSWDIDRTKAQTRGVGYDAVDVTGSMSTANSANAVFRVVIGDEAFDQAFWSEARSWSDIFTTSGTTVVSGWAKRFGGGFQYYNGSGAIVGGPGSQGSFSLTGIS